MNTYLLGASKWTSILGYVVMVVTEIKVYLDEGGLPGTVEGWLTAVLGILAGVYGRITKQSNVTHSALPMEPRPVKDSTTPPPPVP